MCRFGELGIDSRGQWRFMTEEFLNGMQVEAFGDQVCGVTVSKTMGGDVLMDIARFGNRLDGP